VFLNVKSLLLPVIFRDGFINISNGPHDFDALFEGNDRLLSLDRVELVGGNTNDEPVPFFLEPPQDVEMTDVEQVERSVSQNSLRHMVPCSRKAQTTRPSCEKASTIPSGGTTPP